MGPRASSGPDERATTLAATQIVVLAGWVGAAVFFAAVVAPAAFAVLPTRELAGAVVGRALPVLFVSGIAAQVIALAIDIAAMGRPYARVRRAATCVALVACAVAQFGIAPRIATVRAGLSAPLSALPMDDPIRVQFGRLHMLSVAWLGVAILCSIATIALAGLTLRRCEEMI